ncbi:hypothetical protein [Stakelama tenebrarum]|uniref:Uncharacterized protein n=1 Tax=Stakelama tenebrarum TaxID=2711215 RepID=A0A6G6Y4A3_9SPHN|nr:hypothetical protein [Sphingosinithalassobacter tenebrarum]QIG79637.1 hypothetical protein G5C33_07425 [Sphingosinithalassobacter tenebrarum]
MSNAYNNGRRDGQVTTYAPTTDVLKGRGYSDTQVSEYQRGYNSSK